MLYVGVRSDTYKMAIDFLTANPNFYGVTIAGLRQRQVEYLQQASELQKKATELEEVIRRLRGLSDGGSAELDIRHVIIGEFKGHKISLALTLYLRERRGQRIPIDRVVDDLLLAGVDPGKQRSNQTPAQTMRHNLKITVANTPKKVQYDPELSVIWAADTIDEQPKRRVRKAASHVSKGVYTTTSE